VAADLLRLNELREYVKLLLEPLIYLLGFHLLVLEQADLLLQVP